MALPNFRIKEWVSGRLPDFRVAIVASDAAPDFTYEIETGAVLPDYVVQFVAADAVPRPDYRWALASGGGGGGGGTPSAITIDDYPVYQAGNAYTFTARRSGDVSGARTATFTASGATANPATAADFGGSFPTGSFTFLAGSATATFAVTGTSAVQPE